ncbi:MAG TPA: hypothetical protein VF806_03865 [Anaerolineaceae bacterium]
MQQEIFKETNARALVGLAASFKRKSGVVSRWEGYIRDERQRGNPGQHKPVDRQRRNGAVEPKASQR